MVETGEGMRSAAEQVYGRQNKTRLGSEKLYEITKQIIEENIEKGNIKR